jgi:hypothetical protein
MSHIRLFLSGREKSFPEPSGSLAPQQIAAAKATPVKARIVADGQYASAPALKRCKPNE